MLQPKQRLGDFEIIRLLGKGGMGEVYEAQQFHPERRVALKVLAPWLAEDESAFRRFEQEAAVPANLDHPGVVRIIQTGKTEKTAWYAMQLVRGISLSNLMRQSDAARADTLQYEPPETNATGSNVPVKSDEEVATETFDNGPLPTIVDEYRKDKFTTLAKIGANVARALDSAHRQGYLHRDIKPSNLMIDHHNHVYLVDFGLTRALDSATGTRAGAVVGTPWFMSPEQALGHPIDGRSDIFSLGITLYQLATGGKGPYTSRRRDTDAVLREVRSGIMQPIESLAPETPAALERIIKRAVAPKPEDRYQSAAELAAALETFISPGTAQVAVAPANVSHWWRQPWIVATAVVLLVGALAIALRPPSKVDRKPPENPGPDGGVRQQFDRERPLGTKVNLLRIDNQPIEQRELIGEGKLNPLPTELVLKGEGDQPFFVALDRPKERGYEFAVECKEMGQTTERIADLGIFFGWRDKLADPKAQMRFFALKLDARRVLDDVHGRLYIGTWQFGPVQHEQDLLLLPKGRGWMPLPDSKTLKAEGWHSLIVSVRGDEFVVSVDDVRPQTFLLSTLIQTDKRLAAHSLDCHGMLGLWVRNGTGHFRNATVTALPVDD